MLHRLKRKILVVDDDEDFALALKGLFEQEGFEVITAYSENEAVTKSLEEKPDLILLDIMLPTEVEGFHVVWTIRGCEDPEVRDVPIFIVSAIHSTVPIRVYPDMKDSTYGEGEYLPVQAFYDKPVNLEKLIDDVKKFFKRS